MKFKFYAFNEGDASVGIDSWSEWVTVDIPMEREHGAGTFNESATTLQEDLVKVLKNHYEGYVTPTDVLTESEYKQEHYDLYCDEYPDEIIDEGVDDE